MEQHLQDGNPDTGGAPQPEWDRGRSGRRLAIVLRIWGVAVVPLALLMVAGIAYQYTVRSWELGPNILGLGYKLRHLGLFEVSCLVWILAVFWTVIVGIRICFRHGMGWPHRLARLVPILLLLAVLLLGLVPSAGWQRLFAGRIAAGPHAGEFLCRATALGDLATVTAFLEKGVPVNGKDEHGATALHAAVFGDQVAILRLLLAKGADPGLQDRQGRTPKDLAVQLGKSGSVQALNEAPRR